MRAVSTLCALILLTTGLQFADVAAAETWSDVTGKFQVEAEFLSASGGKIYLQKEDGTRIAVPLNRLSPESVELAQRLYQEAISGGGAATPSSDPASATAATGQSKLGDNPTARETAEALTAAMTEFDMVTLWDAFPEKHQNDIEEVVQLAAKGLDEATWNSVTAVLQKINRLVSEKKDFILNNPMVSQAIPNTPETNEMWDAAAELLASYAESSITDQAAMQDFSMDRFISQDVPRMRAAFQKLQSLTEDATDSPFGVTAEVPKIETVSETDSEAVFKITASGQETEQKFVKVDNRWVPAEMIDGWDEEIGQAKQALQQLASPDGQKALAGLQMVTAPLDQLLAAETQEQFDDVVQQQVGMAKGMMGGGPGGPGFGPGGDAFPSGDSPFGEGEEAPPIPEFGGDAEQADAPPIPDFGESSGDDAAPPFPGFGESAGEGDAPAEPEFSFGDE